MRKKSAYFFAVAFLVTAVLNVLGLLESHIKVKGNNEKITTILKTLLLNNVLVLEMKKEKLSLENAFLELEKNN